MKDTMQVKMARKGISIDVKVSVSKLECAKDGL